MSRVILSPKAKSDLGDIWDYTFAEWGIWLSVTIQNV